MVAMTMLLYVPKILQFEHWTWILLSVKVLADPRDGKENVPCPYSTNEWYSLLSPTSNQVVSRESVGNLVQPSIIICSKFSSSKWYTSRYSGSCYIHTRQYQNLRRRAQISSRNTVFTDKAPQMPLHIHLRNLNSYSTPHLSPMCLHHPFRLLLNIHGGSYHSHLSCIRAVCRLSLELRVL